MKYFSYLLLVIFILSCSKKEEIKPVDVDPPILTNLLRTVTRNNLVYQEHNYDSDDRIIISKFYANGVLMEKFTFDYIGDTILLRIVDNINTLKETHKLYYVNDSLSKKAVYLGENEEFAYFLNYIFDLNVCGAKRVDYTSMYGLPIYYFETEYTDQNCSNIRSVYNSEDVFQSKISKVNGDKYSPYSSITLLDFGRREMLRNTIEYRDYNALNELSNVWSYDASFEYNLLDYPTKETREYLNGNVGIFEFVYFSK